jgi:hypothetical protein
VARGTDGARPDGKRRFKHVSSKQSMSAESKASQQQVKHVGKHAAPGLTASGASSMSAASKACQQQVKHVSSMRRQA